MGDLAQLKRVILSAATEGSVVEGRLVCHH
jgi:hypothetical protein